MPILLHLEFVFEHNNEMCNSSSSDLVTTTMSRYDSFFVYVAIDCKPSQDKNGEISSSEHQLEQSEESSDLEEDDEKDSTYISDEEASSVSTDDDYLDTASDLDITPVNPAEVVQQFMLCRVPKQR
ncbi:hypothetical protein ACJJTC_005454 [Scirpophaga incertulas]